MYSLTLQASSSLSCSEPHVDIYLGVLAYTLCLRGVVYEFHLNRKGTWSKTIEVGLFCEPNEVCS